MAKEARTLTPIADVVKAQLVLINGSQKRGEKMKYRVNPIYGRMLKIVNEALIEQGLTLVSPVPDLLAPLRLQEVMNLDGGLSPKDPYQPTAHEVSALRAADLVINGQLEHFLDYSSNLPLAVDHIQKETFDKFLLCACQNSIILRWAVLLHDIAKDRFPRLQKQAEPNPRGADHPELCAETVRAISGCLITRSQTLGEYQLEEKA